MITKLMNNSILIKYILISFIDIKDVKNASERTFTLV